MFRLCGYTGLALGSLLAMIHVARLGLLSSVMAVIILGAVLTFFGLVLVTKIISGEERMAYYHHAVGVMIVTALLVSLLHQPILPYWDVTVLGIGLFLACGRLGCLMAGCCHGRPHSWGVCYGAEYAATPLPSYYLGARLFPVQAVEALLALFIVIAGSLLIWNNHTPGETFAWYVVSYGLGRFLLEFLRGDPERRYLLGFSESQWISFGLLCFVLSMELMGLLLYHSWHAAAVVLMAFTMIGVSWARQYRGSIKYRLLDHGHLRSVAEAVERLSSERIQGTNLICHGATHSPPPIENTTLGIRISASRVPSPVGSAYLYGFSSQNGKMTEEDARTLAKLILQLKHPGGSNELIEGNRGVFHLLIPPLIGAVPAVTRTLGAEDLGLLG